MEQSFSALTLAAGMALSHTADGAPNRSPWRTLVEADLNFIYATLAVNHPGPRDADGTPFRDWLQRGLTTSLALGADAHDAVSAQNVIERYIAGFADAHLFVTFVDMPQSLTWPGFLVARRGEQTLVVQTHPDDPSLPRAGWRLESCDGRTPDAALDDDILTFLDGRKELNATRIAATPWLMTLGTIAGRPAFGACTFTATDGSHTLPLIWRQVPSWTLLPKLAEAAFGLTPVAGHQELRPGYHWLSVPTFAPKTAKNQQALKELVAAAANLQDAKLVVFDVRGNTGGNSSWGYELVKSLYGQPVADAAADHASGSSYAQWRVSVDNLSFLSSGSPAIAAQFGAASHEYLDYQKLVSEMREALAAGKTFVTQPSDTKSPTGAAQPAKPVTAQVVLLTDGRCTSACLDFGDLLLAIPGVIQAGQETSADTLYMDLRKTPLPSGLGTLSFAMKVYRQRPRGSNVPLTPRWTYQGDMADTAALATWLADRAADH